MAIQVSGTTVIDDSKHLTNISGYSGHQAGEYIRSTPTGINRTYFRIGNLTKGRARLILSGYSPWPYWSDQFYGVYDIFGSLTSNSYKVKEVAAEVAPPLGDDPSRTYYSMYSSYVDIVAYASVLSNGYQYNYAWDFYYNIGNHTSIPTLTIIDV